MPSEFQRDLSWSALAFQKVVWPAIKHWFGGGLCIPVEGVTATPFAKALDTYSGIDAWQLDKCLGFRGLASRVQTIAAEQAPYASFTARSSRTSGAETELAKRLRTLAAQPRGFVFPELTIHAYLNPAKDTLRYACAVRSADLYGFIRDGDVSIHYDVRTNGADGNTFVVVWVETLHQARIAVKEYLLHDDLPRRRRLSSAPWILGPAPLYGVGPTDLDTWP